MRRHTWPSGARNTRVGASYAGSAARRISTTSDRPLRLEPLICLNRSAPRLGDQIGLFIKQWHAELQKNRIEIALPFGDETIQLALPFVIERANPECNSVGHALTGGVLQERHDLELAAGPRRKI